MSTTPPDDVAAMFDLPPLPPADPSAGSTLEAAEAALAAELAAEIASGDCADDAPDSRARLRVAVSWPARLRLPGGQVVELLVRNLSEVGVGLVSDEHIPAHTVVDFEMDVPPLAAGDRATPVKGTIKTTYTVAQDSRVLFGGTWQVPPDGLDAVNRWIAGLVA